MFRVSVRSAACFKRFPKIHRNLQNHRARCLSILTGPFALYRARPDPPRGGLSDAAPGSLCITHVHASASAKTHVSTLRSCFTRSAIPLVIPHYGAQTQFLPKKTIQKQTSRPTGALPRVRDLQPIPSLSSASASALPPQAPVQLCVRTYTSDGYACNSSLPPQPVYQIQIQHAARPSVTNLVLHHLGASSKACMLQIPRCRLRCENSASKASSSC